MWYFADVLPTLAELAGAKAPEGIDGLSVVPTLLGESAAERKQAEHEYLYWEHDGSRAVRHGRWKAIRSRLPYHRIALYDLESDVGETRDVSAEHPDVFLRMKGYLESGHVSPRPQIEPKPPAGRQHQ